MAFKSFEQWKAEKAGKTQTNVGAASAAPTSGTPLDTGSGPRPRMTFQQWQAKKQQAAQVSPEVAQEVGKPSAPAPQGNDWERKAPLNQALQSVGETLASGVKAATTYASEQIGAHGARMVALPYAVGTQLIPGGEDFMSTMESATQFGKETVAPIIREEALPTAGALIATVVAPEIAIPAAVGRYGTALSVLVKGMYASLTGGAGATGGTLVREAAKKEGWLHPGSGQAAPSTWGEVVENSISRGAEEAAWTGATAISLGMVPPALRGIVRLGSSPRESMDAFMNIMRKKGGPILLSDVEDGIFINMADSAASHSFLKAGKEMAGAREAQLKAIAEEAVEPLPQLAATAKVTIESYRDGVLMNMPSNVLAEHLTVALKDGEKVARGVVGVRYDAIDDLAETIGTKTVTRQTDEIIRDAAGNPKYDPIFNKVMTKPKVETVVLPKYTVDTTGAKDVIKNLIEERANTLQPDARMDFRKFATEQVNLLKVKDDLTFREARTIMSDMDKEARRLARMETDEFAPTKRKFLLDSMEKLRDAMDTTGAQMAADGVTIEGKAVDVYLKETNGLWKGITDDFGNKYVRSFIDKADSVEGAADTLALTFLKSRESSNALLKALDEAEKYAGSPTMRDYVTKTAEEVQATMPKARAAVSFKVYENVLSMYFNPATKNKALQMLNNPESRGTMSQLMGNDLFNRGDEVIKALNQMESRGVDIGAFTQFARESGALLDAASVAASMGTKGNPSRILATLTAPMAFAYVLKDPKMLKMAQGISVEDDVTKQVAIMTELVRAGVKGVVNDYSNMTEEERQLMEYRVKLQQL
ncbi:hypothetical protein MQM1_022 [Aeromonas phage vB_AsaP_MQM1]|nr:hypothetical protein MQM1_022 [Aeromonas phage vB_AsaP_MQM1]